MSRRPSDRRAGAAGAPIPSRRLPRRPAAPPRPTPPPSTRTSPGRQRPTAATCGGPSRIPCRARSAPPPPAPSARPVGPHWCAAARRWCWAASRPSAPSRWGPARGAAAPCARSPRPPGGGWGPAARWAGPGHGRCRPRGAGPGGAPPCPRAPAARRVAAASAPESARTVLEMILAAAAATGEQVARLRPQAGGTPTATSVLDHVEALLTRIDALVGAEQLQSLRPSAGEVTMLEGIACRYVPDLVDAAADTIGFLQTFEGTARQEALENLASIDQQLNVLAEGVEQIEADLVGGVSRSLEVHAEFLRARFADQHLNPIIDV